MRALVASDHLCTPEYVLERVRALSGGRIALDPCSNPDSTIGATYGLLLENGSDGLASDWSAYVDRAGSFGSAVYVNPPYGRGWLNPWTMKITEEASKGVEIVSLLPLDPTTRWWKRMTSTCSARVLIDHRVRFVGGEHTSGTLKSAMFYHGKRPHLFLHHCGDLGEGLVR